MNHSKQNSNSTDMDDYSSSLIIEAPQLQTLKQRFASSAITLVFWVIWFYLWQPVFTLIAWIFGIKWFYKQMIDLDGSHGFLNVMGVYGIVVILICVVFLGWAMYNYARFRNKKRRGTVWQVTIKSQAELHYLTEEEVIKLKSSRRSVLFVNQTGQITGVDTDLKPLTDRTV